MIVHLRYADTGGTSLVNTHPFTQDGRAFAHNGVVGDLDRIEERLGPNRAMVMGETGSERFFALITLATREAGGDIRAGIRAAVGEVVESYELYSLNFVLGELGHIWAFRYPEHNPLHMLRRGSGGGADGAVDHADSAGTMRLHYEDGDMPMVAWAPIAAFRKPLGVLVFALLFAVGTELWRRQILTEEPPTSDDPLSSPRSGDAVAPSRK